MNYDINWTFKQGKSKKDIEEAHRKTMWATLNKILEVADKESRRTLIDYVAGLADIYSEEEK